MDTTEYKYQYIIKKTTDVLSDTQFDALVNHVGYIYYQLLTGAAPYVIEDGVIGSKYGAFKWDDYFDVFYDIDADELILSSVEYYVWMDELIDDLGIDWEHVEVIAPKIEKSQ